VIPARFIERKREGPALDPSEVRDFFRSYLTGEVADYQMSAFLMEVFFLGLTSAELDELILSLARSLKITFVIVTHELASIFAIADRVIMLDKSVKGIVAAGKPQELRQLF